MAAVDAGTRTLVPKQTNGRAFGQRIPSPLGDHLKTGHTLSVQNRPTGLAEDVIVLPCRSVDLQGVA